MQEHSGTNNKRLIIGVISLLIVALVYSSFPKSYMAFASQSSSINPIKCEVQDNPAFIECCRTFTRGPGDIEIHWCTMCDNTDPPSNCGDRYPEPVAQIPPAPSPKGPLGTILPGGEVLRELEQTPPSPALVPEGALPQGEVQQPIPPLFGRNVPLQGGVFGQEPTTATTTDEPSPEPTPVLSPPPSPPVATDVSPDLAPEEDVGPFPTPPTTPVPPVPPPTTPVHPVPPPGQEDTDDGRDDLLPDTGITEQPEVQQPEQEQEQEEPSNEGQETAGPLT